jgi:hypothetical protein
MPFWRSFWLGFWYVAGPASSRDPLPEVDNPYAARIGANTAGLLILSVLFAACYVVAQL